MNELKSRELLLKEEFEQLDKERADFLSRRARFEFNINDNEEELRQSKVSIELANQELVRVERQIASHESELEHITPEYNHLKAKEFELIQERDQSEQKRNEIYAKQGRSTRFRNKEDRDRWIKNELEILNKAIKDKNSMADKLKAELKSDQQRADTFKSDIIDLTKRADEQNVIIEELERTQFDIIRKKDEMQIKRNDFWRKEIGLTQELTQLRDDLAKCEQNLRTITGRTILQGKVEFFLYSIY